MLAALAAAPLAGRAETFLLVDDSPVLYRSGTKRVFHPPTRYPGNAVLTPDRPWEFTVSYHSVLRDSPTGRYRMWYQAQEPASGERLAVCYAESADGIHWDKPALGLNAYGGTKATNIVMPAVDGRRVPGSTEADAVRCKETGSPRRLGGTTAMARRCLREPISSGSICATRKSLH